MNLAFTLHRSRSSPSQELSGKVETSSNGGSVPVGRFLPVVIAISLILFVQRASTTSFCCDDFFSLQAALQPTIGETIAMVENDVHPPLYFLLLRFWITLTGTDEFLVKMMSAFFAIASLPLVWYLGQILFAPRVGMLSAWLFAISPIILHFGTFARYYTLGMWLGLASLVVLLSAVQKPYHALWKYLLFGFLWSLTMYASHLAGIVVLVLGPFFLLHSTRGYVLKQKAFYFMSGIMVGGVIYLPQIKVTLAQIRHFGGGGGPQGVASSGLQGWLARLGYTVYAYISGEAITNPAWAVIGLVLVMLILVPVILALIYYSTRPVYILGMGVVVAHLAVLSIFDFTGILFTATPSRALLLFPLTLVFVVGACDSLLREGRKSSTRRLRLLLPLLLVGVSSYFMVADYQLLVQGDAFQSTEKLPFRDLAIMLNKLPGNGNLVVLDSNNSDSGWYLQARYIWNRPEEYERVLSQLREDNILQCLYLVRLNRDLTSDLRSSRFLAEVSSLYIQESSYAFVPEGDLPRMLDSLLLHRERPRYVMSLHVFKNPAYSGNCSRVLSGLDKLVTNANTDHP